MENGGFGQCAAGHLEIEAAAIVATDIHPVSDARGDADFRRAMVRVVGGPGDHATRIENRIGEPAANPYLYMAAQIHAGLDGLTRGLEPPPACETPYAADHPKIPDTLGNALGCLRADTALIAGLGADVVHHFCRIKQQEIDRHADAKDKTDFDRREYFSRI